MGPLAKRTLSRLDSSLRACSRKIHLSIHRVTTRSHSNRESYRISELNTVWPGSCACDSHEEPKIFDRQERCSAKRGVIGGLLGRCTRRQVRIAVLFLPLVSIGTDHPSVTALMEYHCTKATDVTMRIFEKGLENFPDEVEFALRYLGFLISINDESSKPFASGAANFLY